MHGTSRGPAYPPRPRREPRGRRGAGPPRANKCKKRRAPLGKGGWHVVKWAGERVGEHRVAASTDGVRRGAARRSRGAARGGAIPGCACRLAGRGGANVRHGGCGGRETPVRAARHAKLLWRGADPVRGPTSTTPLWRGSGGGVAVVAGTRLGGRAGTPSPGVVAGRAGTPRHATRGLYGGRGSSSWKGRGPSAVDSTPPRAVPKYPEPGQQGNDLSRSRGDRIRSGAGLFPSGFPDPPTTC